MEAWARARIDDARFRMTSDLEENVERSTGGPEQVFALAALRMCRTTWKDLTDTIPVVPKADPSVCPELQFQNLLKMNIGLRSQLKEANRIARSVYRIVIGPMSASARTQETVFCTLEQGVKQVRREMFVLQHGQESESEFDEISFSIRDFLQLADFKMSHAAKRIFEVETNAAGSDGSGIDWEFRVQELTRDLRAQLARATRTSEVEQSKAAEAMRQLRNEVEAQRTESLEQQAAVRQQCDKQIKAFKEAFEVDIRDMSDEISRRLQELQIAFVHKMGELRELDAESKAVSIRALQQVLVGERVKLEERAKLLGNADASLERHDARYIGDTAVYDDPEDVHTKWEGETHETLVRLLKGKRAEIDMLQRSNNVQMRLKNMEWETNLRDVMRQYEEEIGRLREKMKHLEAEAEHAAKLVTVRMQETAEARAETVRTQRQMQDEMLRQRQKNDADISAMNQEVMQISQQFSNSAQTVVQQEKQISEMTAYKNELLDELDDAHAVIASLKAAVPVAAASTKPVVATADVETQTANRRSADSAEEKTRHAKLRSMHATVQQALRQNRDRRTPSEDASDVDAPTPALPHVSTTLGTQQTGSQLATTAHSRRDSLAQQYFAPPSSNQRTREGRESSGDGDGAVQPYGVVVVPAEYTVAKARRRLNAASMALDQQQHLHVDDDFDGSEQDQPSKSPPRTPQPRQRRKSKFSEWYAEQQKAKLAAPSLTERELSGSSVRKKRGGLRGSSSYERSPQEPPLGVLGAEERDWISAALQPDYLSKLLTPDPMDAKILAGDDLGPHSIASLSGPPVAAAIHTAEDAEPRLVNEPNFYRIVCKIAVAVEFATASPSQHTQSLAIKRLSAMLPNSETYLNTSATRPVVVLDLVCVSQFLATFWLPRLDQIRSRAQTTEVQWQSKDAYNQLTQALQKLRDLSIPISVLDIPIEDLQKYLAAEASGLPMRPTPPASASAGGGAKAKVTTSPSLRVIHASHVKPLLTPIIHVMGFMFSTGRHGTLEDIVPHGVLSRNGSPVRAMSPAPFPSSPPLVLRASHTGEMREAMMIVSNVQRALGGTFPQLPSAYVGHQSSIAHLVDAQNVRTQMKSLKKSSEVAFKRRVHQPIGHHVHPPHTQPNGTTPSFVMEGIAKTPQSPRR